MDGWSPVVTTASDNDRSGFEEEFMGGTEDGHDGRGTPVEEQRTPAEGMDGDAVVDTVGFGISGIGEGKVMLGRVGQRDDRELRYLHLLWDPGRAERATSDPGVPSKLGKIPGSRVRRQQHRMVRSLCPIGKDIYGNKN